MATQMQQDKCGATAVVGDASATVQPEVAAASNVTGGASRPAMGALKGITP